MKLSFQGPKVCILSLLWNGVDQGGRRDQSGRLRSIRLEILLARHITAKSILLSLSAKTISSPLIGGR